MLSDACPICESPIEGPRLTDAETGSQFHAACVVNRVPEDAVVRLAGLLALALAPLVVVWAG